MYNYDPFNTNLECCDDTLPNQCVDQFNPAYPQYTSEIMSLILIPFGLEKPTDWTTPEGWENIIKNDDPTKGNIIAGIGRLVPTVNDVRLSGRVDINSHHTHELNFRPTNINAATKKIMDMINCPFNKFCVYLQTTARRTIGSDQGLIPIYQKADITFNEGGESVELMNIQMRFFGNYMKYSDVFFFIQSDEIPQVWGDPAINEIWGDPSATEGWQA